MENSDQPHTFRSFLGDLRDAVTGKQHDYTTGSISRAIILLSIPMVLEMLMESIFAVVDIFFVGKLGPDAIAVIGLTESMLTIIFALAIGLSAATTAMVARRIGAKDPDAARVAALQSIYLGVFASIPISVIGIVFAEDLLRLMGASESVVAMGSTNVAIMLGGNVVIMLIFLINAIFRGAGNAAIAMRVLWLSNAINIVLDPCLIFGWGPFPEMGVAGAAVATNIGRGVGVLCQLLVLFNGTGLIQLSIKKLSLAWDIIFRLVQISVGGIFQYLIATTSWIFLMRIVAEFGSEALAGYTVAIRIFIFALLPAWGVGNAAATLMGQNLGAGQPDRAARSVWITGVYNMIFLGVVGIFLFIFAQPLVAFFNDSPTVVAQGVTCLRLISVCYGPLALGLVLAQALNGAGDTTTPTIINALCYWVAQIPMAYLLAFNFKMEATGVYIAIAVSESLLAVFGVYFFRKGKWRTREV